VSWQKRARLVLAVAGLGLAGVLFYLSRREPPGPSPEPPIAKLDPGVNLAAGVGTLLIYDREGRPDLQISFKGSSVFADGRLRYEAASITELGGGKSSVSADFIETGARAPGVDRADRYDFRGNVRMTTGDGLLVETDTAVYDDTTGVITMPGPLKYRRGRLSGTGTGAIYDRTQELITLQQNAVARVEPDAQGKGAADATASRMLLARGQHSLRMEQNARIVSQTETLSGDNAIILFTDDETAVKFMELRGNARVEPSAEGQAGMSATDITMSFQPDGQTLQHATLTGNGELRLRDKAGLRTVRGSWIDLVTAADGRTLTSLQARDKVVVDIPPAGAAPGRVITADTLDAKGDEKRGLTSARFEGKPSFEERPSAKSSQAKTATATTLVLALAGQIDAIESAQFQQNVVFKQGQTNAKADQAVYREQSGVLELRRAATAGKQSEVDQERLSVTARDIDLTTASENLEATGSVRTRMERDKARAAKAAGSLFEGTDPIIGAADRLEYRRDSGQATYTGNARSLASLSQGATSVSGETIVFVESSNQLTARGKVESELQMAPTEAEAKAGKLKTYGVRADTLQYDDAKRVAVYQGQPAVLKTVDGDIEGGTLTFVLAETSRTLKTMRATGVAFARLAGGYEAVGDTLDYDAATEVYTLRSTRAGSLARVKSPKKVEPGAPVSDACTLSESTIIEFNVRAGEVQMPGKGEANKTTTEKPCASIDLRPSRPPR
jgi:lipopolysaccharide export system protein LptA